MKVAIFSRAFNGIAGGVEKMVIALALELVKRNHEVIVISLDKFDAKPFFKWPKTVTWYPLGIGEHDKKASFLVRVNRVFKIRNILKENSIQSIIGFQSGAFALVKAASLGLNLHSIAAERNSPTLFNYLKRGKLRKIYHQLILSSASTIAIQFESFSKLYWKPLRKRIVITPNPNLSVLRTMPKRNKVEYPRLLFIGRLTFQKNPAVLLHAMKLLDPHCKLTIIGNGPDETLLQDLSSKLNLNVTFASPAVDLEEYYLKHDVLVLPSRWEGFPNVVLEALSLGLPVVGFEQCAGVADLIIPGINGELAEGSDDFTSLATAINKALMNFYNTDEIIATVSPFTIERFGNQWEKALGLKFE